MNRYHATNLGSVLTAQGRRYDWLADQIGVHKSLVTHLLKGRRTVDLETATKIADILQTPLFLLFELSNDSKSVSTESEETAA